MKISGTWQSYTVTVMNTKRPSTKTRIATTTDTTSMYMTRCQPVLTVTGIVTNRCGTAPACAGRAPCASPLSQG